MASLNHSAIERFWSKVDKGAGDGCWEWMGWKSSEGYGRLDVGSARPYAHRIAWELANGSIPDGMQIDHMCHNRACVRVEHLRLATCSQNNQNRRGASRRSKSGVRGVYWDKSKNKWDALARQGGKKTRVGRFRSLEEAEAAIIAWRRENMPYSIMDQAA